MHIFSQQPYPDNYKAFQQQRGSQMEPLQKPQRLPALPLGLDAGQLPSLAELEAAVAAAFFDRQAPEVKHCAFPVLCLSYLAIPILPFRSCHSYLAFPILS